MASVKVFNGLFAHRWLNPPVKPITNVIALGLASGMAIGADPGAPVTDEYLPPYSFTGKLYRVTIDVSGDLIQDSEAEMRIVMARQ